MKYLFITILLLSGIEAKSQVWAQAGGGLTNQFLSAELQVGYRYNSTFLSVGFIAIKDAGSPVLINTRVGAIVLNREEHCITVHAGYVRSQQSLENKPRNSDTWQVGGQYHFCFYKRTNFYTEVTYTYKSRVSVGVGMTFNLFRE